MAFIESLTVADLAVALFFLGLYGAMTQRNIIKTIMSVGIMDVAAITFFMMVNHQSGARPPVSGAHPSEMADPLPQALMITAIVIGVSVIAMCLAMYMRVAYRYGTADWKILIRRLEK
ncbi:NADH-ubiquinone oxidoreductase, chain 4L [Alkalispirochaeta sphaeroplastigenens]|uniref:NADH-ubiquinone oxidoreductase, chain 4L n=1 Tax=Alkalispirochaeta sphaeroplastigenens TaxID=1187066 RepID=A0A2S4JG56_9SPIO|nr:cation:proton antiporter subunit C [Alkalispirochaeta sphaeroplastigenens]POQ98496.1 NADH-ubiquinone oxidoreductase, chain 4L [Alkalispirochaeta sphaeroplastigenens]